MKIALAQKREWSRFFGHAGQTPGRLVHHCRTGQPIPAPRRITLTGAKLPHHSNDDGSMPLREVEIVVAAGVGAGCVRRMRAWGAEVPLAGEPDPHTAPERVCAGRALADKRHDVTTTRWRTRNTVLAGR